MPCIALQPVGVRNASIPNKMYGTMIYNESPIFTPPKTNCWGPKNDGPWKWWPRLSRWPFLVSILKCLHGRGCGAASRLAGSMRMWPNNFPCDFEWPVVFAFEHIVFFLFCPLYGNMARESREQQLQNYFNIRVTSAWEGQMDVQEILVPVNMQTNNCRCQSDSNVSWEGNHSKSKSHSW